MKRSFILTTLLVLCFALALSACNQQSQGSSNPTTAPSVTTQPDNGPEAVLDLVLVVTEDTISTLEQYPNLKNADLSGSTCYDAILEYMEKHPNVDVTYTVDVGGTTLSSKDTDVTLAQGSYDYDTLMAKIGYLPNITGLHLPKTELNAQQFGALKALCPGADYTLELDGQEVAFALAGITLSSVTADRVDYYVQRLEMLPSLAAVDLTGSELSVADVKKLKDAAPNATFQYSFTLFGQTVSTSSQRVEFKDVTIGDEGEQQIRDALSIMDNCTYFLLDNCGLSNDVLAGIRDDFPNTQVVWRIFQTNKNRSWLTDTEVLRAVYGVDDSNSGVFKYCTKVKYLDFGHNEKMHDLSFLSYMPDLEIAILSGSEISDLTPLSGLKKLEFLELGWCGWLKDVSPLSTCEGLKYLNLSHTKANNVSSLAGLNLEMLHYVNSGNRANMTAGDWAAIKKLFPNCWITYEPLHDSTANPYGKGWRYNNDNSYTTAYKKVRVAFNYDSIDNILNGGGNAAVVTPPTPTGDDAVKKITKVVTAETIAELDKYKNLQEADLSGSTCYEAILSYMKTHPMVKVTFTVSLGKSTKVENTTVNLTLKDGKYKYDSVKKNLKYITDLKYVSLPSTTLTAEKITALKEAYPDLAFNYTIPVQGSELNDTDTAIDLSAITSDQVDDFSKQLSAHPNIVWVELTAKDGSNNLSIADVKKLQTANPHIVFHYTFQLFGKTVSTTDEKIEFVKASINNKGEKKIREALDILKGCRYFKLDNCGLTNSVLAGIRDDYPNVKVVWRVFQANQNRSWLTDTEVLRAVYGVNDKNSGVFKYCTDVKYMDFGHNTEMVDISFMAYMPNLEIAILSGSPIKDLSPLSNCKKLQFLEIAWCGHVKDISPLAQCDSLRYLNLGHTNVKDMSPLYNLDMEMLSFVNSGNRLNYTEAHWEEIQASMPDCWITFLPLFDNNASPYSVGWRYKASGGYTEIYRKVRDVFGYDAIDKLLK